MTVTGTGKSPIFDSLELAAQAPIRLDLGAGQAQWLSEGDHRLDLRVDGVRLSGMRTWAPGMPRLSAVAHATLAVTGTAHAPRVDAALGIEEILVDDTPLGRLTAKASYADGAARTEATLHMDDRTSIDILASAPIDVDPVAGTFAWHRDRDHRLHLKVVNLDQAAVAPFVPVPKGVGLLVGLPLDGHGGGRISRHKER